MRASVFADTEPDTFPPFDSIKDCSSFLLVLFKEPVTTKVFPLKSSEEVFSDFMKVICFNNSITNVIFSFLEKKLTKESAITSPIPSISINSSFVTAVKSKADSKSNTLQIFSQLDNPKLGIPIA